MINQPGQLITSSSQQQHSGAYIYLTGRNGWTTTSIDYYTLMFNFPLRKNGKVIDGCRDGSNNPYGDAYYH